MRLLVTDPALQALRQATAWLIMTLGRNMNTQIQALIDAGALIDKSAIEAALVRVPTSVYHELQSRLPNSFSFLATIPIESVLAFIRALSFAENLRLCPYPGSVSLLIPAYFACRLRGDQDSAIVADWIVVNHKNPYTPFNFQSTREYWESARIDSTSPLATYHRVCEMEREAEDRKFQRAKHHEITEGIMKLRKGVAPTSPSLREDIIHRMEKEINER